MKKRLIFLCLLVCAVTACAHKETDCAAILGECAELGTVEYTCDLLFQNQPAKYESFKPGPRIILYSAKVYLKAGVDLQDKSAIHAVVSPDGRSVDVTLPRPVLLEWKMEPKDVNKEFEKIGLFRWRFTNEEKLSIRQRAEMELRYQLLGDNPRIPILEDAEKNARAEVELLLRATGRYDNITINFTGNEKVR